MPAPRDVVLLLTHAGDTFTVERVAEGVARRGGRPVRVDTDRFPSTLAVTSQRGLRSAARLRVDGVEIADEQVRAVWHRRIRPPAPDADLDPAFAAECAAESRAALDGLVDSLADATWIDPPERVRVAANKLLQLRLAAEVGLRVPETIVTNDPAEVHALHARVGALVAKLLRALTVEMGAPSRAVYTSAVSADDLGDLGGLAACPMVFQERIAVGCELRVAYVDGRCFVGAIRPGTPDPDWRRAPGSWMPATLDGYTERAVRRLMNRLRLTYGALDLIRTPAGEHVFLEVNPVGEWGMLERDLGLPVGDAIAEALVAPR